MLSSTSTDSDSDFPPTASQRVNCSPRLGTQSRPPSLLSVASSVRSVASRSLCQLTQLATQLVNTVNDQLKSTRDNADLREQRMLNEMAEREHRLLVDAADRESRLLSAAAERDRRACDEYSNREHALIKDAASVRDALLAHDQHAREIEAERERRLLDDVQQRERDLRRDMYDLAAQRSRAAALEAELTCLKAKIGPSTVAPVRSADIPPPEINTAMQMSPTRPVTPVTNIADALTLVSDATDIFAVCDGRAAGVSTLRPPCLFTGDESTAQYMPPQPSGSVRTRRRLPHLPAAAMSDLGPDTPSRRLLHTSSRSPPETLVTSMVPRPPRTPSRDEVMTSMLPPRPLAVPVDQVMTSVMPSRTPTFLDPPAGDDALMSALTRQPAAIMSDPVLPPYQSHMPLHTFSRLPPDSTGAVTSRLPYQPPCVPPRPPLVDELMTSMPPRPLAVSTHDAMTSTALPRLPATLSDLLTGDDVIQRPVAPVDSRNLYTHSIDRLLAELPQPPPPHRHLMPLSSENIQTTASRYVHIDSVPPLSTQRYANLPYYGSAPSSQPTVSTLAYAPTYVGAPQWSYTENSQSLPIAVEQAGLSNFTHVDVQHSRPAVVDSTGQHYTICTPATTDAVRPIVTAHTAPLQSPSVHWRKRFAYDYIQPDAGMGASTHAAPAIHSGYVKPQTSVHLHTLSAGEGQSMTNVGPPQPHQPPSAYVPHGHIMPLQVPTVPSAVPPPSHLPVQVPISSSETQSRTYMCHKRIQSWQTYMHLSLTSRLLPPPVHVLSLRSHSLLPPLHSHTLSCIHNQFHTQQLTLMHCQLD